MHPLTESVDLGLVCSFVGGLCFTLFPAVLQTIFNLFLGPPPPESPGGGPDYQFPIEMVVLGRFRPGCGGNIFSLFVLALSAARSSVSLALPLCLLLPLAWSCRLGGPAALGMDLYPMVRNSASGPEIGLPGRMSARF